MKKTIFLMIVLLVAVGLVSCSSFMSNKKKPRVVATKRKPLYSKPQTTETAVTSPATPLLAEGIERLKNSKNEEAEWKFEEAVNLDPNYGPAYYWLARAKYRLEEVKDALNLLEKAESLLKRSAVWMDRIQQFKAFLQEKT